MTDFSMFQLSTYQKVKSLSEQIEAKLDPTTFVLNKEVQELMNQLADARNDCDHIWNDGVCLVCGAIQDLEDAPNA